MIEISILDQKDRHYSFEISDQSLHEVPETISKNKISLNVEEKGYVSDKKTISEVALISKTEKGSLKSQDSIISDDKEKRGKSSVDKIKKKLESFSLNWGKKKEPSSETNRSIS